MFKKILVPLDGSENAEKALPWIKRYSKPDRAMVVLTSVVPKEVPAQQGEWTGKDRAAEYLQRIEKELNYAGIPVKVRVIEGRAPIKIIQLAQQEGCSLILMTTRGKSRIGRWRVGGVTAQVMRLSTVPVLAVRSQTRMAHQGRVRRILVPLDGSGLSESILPQAEKLARYHKARVTFLHVSWEPAKGDTAAARRMESIRRRTGRACKDLRKRGVKAVVRLEHGDAAAEILYLASRFDLIAMTTHGFGGFKRWVFGSVAEKVISQSPVPVFVFRGKASAKRRSLEGVVA